MRNVSEKKIVEKIKIKILRSIIFFPRKPYRLWNMRKIMVQPEIPKMTR